MTTRNPRRADFPLLAANPGLYYLDSAATSQKPRVVLDAMRDYYERDNLAYREWDTISRDRAKFDAWLEAL